MDLDALPERFALHDQNSIAPVRATPFCACGRLSLKDLHSRLCGVFRKAWAGGEMARLPPVEDQVRGFVCKWSVEDFVTPENSFDDRLIRAWVFELFQLFADKLQQRLIFALLDNAGGLQAFEIYPDARRRGEHFTAVGFCATPIDFRKRGERAFEPLAQCWKALSEIAFSTVAEVAAQQRVGAADDLLRQLLERGTVVFMVMKQTKLGQIAIEVNNAVGS